jgi:aquaporin Z
MLLASALLGGILAHPDVNHVRTLPGPGGAWPAIAAEVGMTFVLMSVVLEVSSRPRIARFTGLSAASLVAVYIPLFAPVSGMSMNPARSAGSAAAAGSIELLWIYFTAPLAGMLLAAEAHRFRILSGALSAGCAKLDHDDAERCIFCGADPASGGGSVSHP